MCGFVEQVKVEDRRPGVTLTGNGRAALWCNDAVLRRDLSLDPTSTSFLKLNPDDSENGERQLG
jgi:hypothetical protein